MIVTEAWQWQDGVEPRDLILADKKLPEPEAGQVLVENCAIGLNPVDWKLISRRLETWKPGRVPGVDGMGVVAMLGSEATHVRVGTRVAYHTDLRFNGSFARHTLVPAYALIPVPDHVSDESAAALPCPGLTAWQAVRKVPHLIGENVLVNGAGGSVGLIMTQLLVAEGAKVHVTARSHHHARLLNLGVVAAYDYHRSDWTTYLRSTLASQRLYAVFDTVGPDCARMLVDLLDYYGHIVTVQGRITQAPQMPFTTCVSYHEIALGAAHQYATSAQWHEMVKAGEGLLHAVGRRELRQTIIDAAPFVELAGSLEKLKQRNDGVKYVVRV